eukprot:g11207.t2
MYGRGSLESIGIFVPSRGPLQIEAHAREHFARVESARPGEVQVAAQRAPSGRASSSSPSSSSPLRDDGSGGGGDGGGGGGEGDGGGSQWETPVVAHLVYGVHAFQQEEELCHCHMGMYDATAIGILDGLMAVANDGVYAEQQQQQQQQEPMSGEGYQAGEHVGTLVSDGTSYPHRRVWAEPALGRELRSWCGLDDFGGVL